MDWKKEEISEKFSSNLDNKTYLLSSNGIWLFRFLNGAFGSKWCGVWNRDIKLLDYFAFKVNGEWLSPDKAKEFIYDGISAMHLYTIKGFDVWEKISPLPRGFSIRLLSSRPLRVEAELGINIRYRQENMHHRSYEMEFAPGVLKVSSSLSSLLISSENLDFIRNPSRSYHFPGRYAHSMGYDWEEEEQERFIPGSIIFSGVNPELRIEVNGRTSIDAKVYRKEIKSKVKKIAERIFEKTQDKKLSWKIASTLFSFFVRGENKVLVFAGYPYFNEFWSRDFLWVARELYSLGFEGEVLEAIEFISSKVKEKEIPAVVWREEKGTSSDALPLLLLFLLKLKPKAPETAKLVYATLPDVAEAFVSFGFVPHKETGTWMDSVARKGAIEIQFLWASVFLEASKRYASSVFEDVGFEILRNIKRNYWQKEGFFLDAIEGPFKFTANQFVGSLLQLLGPEKEIPMIRNALALLPTTYGFRAVAREECSTGYHCIGWGLITWWVLNAISKYRPAETEYYLKSYLRLMSSRTVFAMPEIFTENGPKGASSQLWSIAWIPGIVERVRKG